MVTIEDRRAATRAKLLRTALRGFGPPEVEPDLKALHFQQRLGTDDAPVPGLLQLAMQLVDAKMLGPAEKVLWVAEFDYDRESYSLAHAKFGVKLAIHTVSSEEDARRLLTGVIGKLRAASRIVESMVLESADETIGRGDVTVLNQHRQLRQAYDYFRERATNPEHVEDLNEEGESEFGRWWSNIVGANVMAMNARHDFVAAITAYFSSLEHDLVLYLAFADFDTQRDDLAASIRSRWGEKWKRLHGSNMLGNRHYSDLVQVAERWRNPYAHGGFEKGHGATLFLHTEGIGALPVGMTSWTDSPRYSLYTTATDEIDDVFAFFDDLDGWLARKHPEATEWIDSGLPVRFDEQFRRELSSARANGEFAEFLRQQEWLHDRNMNMDF